MRRQWPRNDVQRGAVLSREAEKPEEVVRGSLSFKAVIFDFDGTLVDSLCGIAAAMNEALGEMGLPEHTLESYRAKVGEGVGILAKRVLPEDWPGSTKELILRYRQHYRQRMWESVRLYEGIPALLDKLKELKIPMAVLSNKGDEFIQLLSKGLLASWAFADIRGERMGVPKKPDPTSALEVAQTLRVKPEETVFVGDTLVDMQTAHAAGMRAIGVSWGFRGEEELHKAGASFVLNAPLQLLYI
ncbi:MAG: HAD family hydrolase [Proteobacteria bacterium]|nr:HAD family hydrolase [Cystobacterineae bacterium]MCL2258435.1 HAD family hydrolase [Cystobacterineae bacterium]MCL2315228.1 HAD family hydrolase [Pseudomonadota bacterium]